MQVFRHLHNLDLQFHLNRQTGAAAGNTPCTWHSMRAESYMQPTRQSCRCVYSGPVVMSAHIKRMLCSTWQLQWCVSLDVYGLLLLRAQVR